MTREMPGSYSWVGTDAPWVDLDVPQNLRDLGGVPVVGGAVRSGTIFRSDSLVGLSDADITRLTEAMAIRTVIDLRTFEEVEHGSTELATRGVAFHHIPIIKSFESGQEKKDVPRSMMEGYLAMFEASGPGFARAMEILAEPGALPAVFHCAAGKDRTGILAATLLSLLGAGPGAIAGEYALTALRIDRIKIRLAGDLRYADVVKLAGNGNDASEPGTMLGLLENIHERHGGVERYLLGSGMDPAIPSRLRASATAA